MAISITKLKLLLLHDNPVVSGRGLHSTLSRESGVELTAHQSGSRDEAVRLAEKHRSDVVLLHHCGPVERLLDTLRALREAFPHIGMVVLAAGSAEVELQRTLQAGANGYLLENAPPQLISIAVRAASRGASLVPSELLWRTTAPPAASRPLPSLSGRTVVLTAREQQVLRLLTDGFSNKELSTQLGLAVATIKKHIQSIISKLGVSSRTEAALLAVREKLFD